MKKSLPNVGRFMICAGLLYLGFLFCGWVVLGPYSVKVYIGVIVSSGVKELIGDGCLVRESADVVGVFVLFDQRRRHVRNFLHHLGTKSRREVVRSHLSLSIHLLLHLYGSVPLHLHHHGRLRDRQSESPAL